MDGYLDVLHVVRSCCRGDFVISKISNSKCYWVLARCLLHDVAAILHFICDLLGLFFVRRIGRESWSRSDLRFICLFPYDCLCSYDLFYCKIQILSHPNDKHKQFKPKR